MKNFKSQWKKCFSNTLAQQLNAERLDFLFDFILANGNKQLTYKRLAVESLGLLNGDLGKTAQVFLVDNVAISRSPASQRVHFVALVRLGQLYGFSESVADFCHQQLKKNNNNLNHFMYLYFKTESEKDGNVIEYLPSEGSHAADLLEWGEELAKIDNISSDVLQYFARHGLDNYDLFDGLPHECVLALLLQKREHAKACQYQIFDWWQATYTEFSKNNYDDPDIIEDAIKLAQLLQSDARPMLQGFEERLHYYLNAEIDCYPNKVNDALIMYGLPTDNTIDGLKQLLFLGKTKALNPFPIVLDLVNIIAALKQYEHPNT